MLNWDSYIGVYFPYIRVFSDIMEYYGYDRYDRDDGWDV